MGGFVLLKIGDWVCIDLNKGIVDILIFDEEFVQCCVDLEV